ncbi:MAG: hypothetical protein K6E92_02110 [Lachnospiraceae bacterium]|nr:hypothetical protein [Lachnospiraceae bacterium]
MKYAHPRPNTGNRSGGSLSWVPGLFAVCFVTILVESVMTFYRCRAASDALEDALSGCAMAAALIDVQIYGSTHDLVIGDAMAARDRYLDALREDLGLDAQMQPGPGSLIDGPVTLELFCVYDLRGSEVTQTALYPDGRYGQTTGVAGVLTAPNGQPVPSAGIYGEISFPVRLPFGIRVMARKSQLVTVNERNSI